MGVEPQALSEHPHRRLNPLTGEWVLVSAHRTKRPWQGQIERTPQPADVAYDPKCYLCPGNERAGDKRNPPYQSTFVFDNDFPALIPEIPAVERVEHRLLTAQPERGICRVVCFSPNHGLTIARMDRAAIRKVVDTWVAQYIEIGAMPFIRYVQIFENRGEMMGASNPHPHCQIWAVESIPDHAAREDTKQREWQEQRGGCLLCEYLTVESGGSRIVCENASFAAVVPFWAVWPFETMIVSRRHLGGMSEFSQAERDDLADILKRLTTRYDNLFEAPFPYTMGFHQIPTDGESRPWWHFHAHYYPPLLRSATVRKFMVGFELLGSPQRDLTAESAAERLRGCSEVHYLDQV
jgi:UDPglucose--hexose-1-phosphate uridylyltransferase